MTGLRIEVPWEKYGTIAYLAEHVPVLGKTALQKLVYFMQEWKQVPLGYRFELYTYGPFSPELMGDLDYADSLGAVKVEYILNGGYHIQSGDRNKALQERASDFLAKYSSQISKVVEVFGKRSAKDLELLATLHYVYREHKSTGDADSEEVLVNGVCDLKPGKFSKDQIKTEIAYLREHKVI